MMTALFQLDQFVLDLVYSGGSYNTELDKKVVIELLAACHNNLNRLGNEEYKRARNEALEDALIVGTIVDSEWDAYKDIIDRRFQRKAKEAHSFKFRPFAPLQSYLDGR